MKSLTTQEREFIDAAIRNGKENFFIEFKEKYKHLYKGKDKSGYDGAIDGNEANSGIFMCLKECLGFLNELSISDKYLIFGITDDGEVKGISDKVVILEEQVQEVFSSYITPVPNIRIIDNYQFEDIDDKKKKRLIIFKIDKNNQQKIYTLAKKISVESKKSLNPGDSFLRFGTRVQMITSMNAVTLTKRIDNSMFTLLSASYDFNIAKAHDILKFVEVLDIIVNKNLLMDAGNRNINLTIEFNNLFDKYISKAGFDDIVETKVIDGGIKSLCESIFFISRLLFEIKEEGFFNFRESNTKIILEANSDELNNTKFIEAKQKIDRINKLLSQYINYQYSYGSSYFFKITEVAFTRSIKEIYGENDLKFTVSDDIMKLFLEPLYSANNPLNIALRELLQNSFDACKKVRLENGGFSEIIVDFFMEYNNLCEIYLSDNGLGMNLEDIRQHYLRVGKSSKSEDKSLGLIGRFGIGALANFLVGSTCDIVTKRSNDSMEYSFTIEKDDFNVKNLIGKKVNRFKESYTKIKIRADEELQKEYRIKEIVEELGIEKMLLNEDINLVFNFKNLNADGSNEVVETRKVHALNSYNLEFFSEIFLGNDSQAKVYIFDHIKYRSESEKSDFEDEKEKFKIISNHSGNILYNNQIGKVNFHTPIGRNNFYASNLPLIVVNGYVSPDEGYTPELSRNVYNIGSIFSTNIIKKRYEIGIPRVIDRIENINETSENPLNEIVALSNFAKDNSIVLPNIIFSKGQIELYVDKSDIDFKIYANELTPTQLESLNISEELRYTQQGILSDKSFVASVIEQQKSIVISRNFVDRFLIKANSSQNGFRRGALLSLLKSIGLEDLYQGKNLIEVWRKLDSSKEIIIRKLDDIEKNSLIPLTDDGSRLLEQMKGNNLKFPNLIISKNPTLSLPDEEFRKIYKECINNNNF